MAKRRTTPDVLSDVLGDMPATPAQEKKPQAPPGMEPTEPADESKAEEQQGRGEAPAKPKKAPAKATKPTPEKPAEPVEKHAATFYLTPDSIDALEETWIKLRRLKKKGSKKDVSKSKIVELALQAALEEFEEKGKQSNVAKQLVG